MKKTWISLAMLALFVGMAGKVWAINPDALTITIMPNVGYGVDIDTFGITLDFTSDLNQYLDVAKPSTVTITSTFAQTELLLNVNISAAGNEWTIGSTTATDTLQGWVLYTSTTVASMPTKGAEYFDDTNDRIVSGDNTLPAGDTVKFEDGAFQTDNQVPGTKSHMWIKFHMPKDLTPAKAVQQTLKYTLTAQAPN